MQALGGHSEGYLRAGGSPGKTKGLGRKTSEALDGSLLHVEGGVACSGQTPSPGGDTWLEKLQGPQPTDGPAFGLSGVSFHVL